MIPEWEQDCLATLLSRVAYSTPDQNKELISLSWAFYWAAHNKDQSLPVNEVYELFNQYLTAISLYIPTKQLVEFKVHTLLPNRLGEYTNYQDETGRQYQGFRNHLEATVENLLTRRSATSMRPLNLSEDPEEEASEETPDTKKAQDNPMRLRLLEMVDWDGFKKQNFFYEEDKLQSLHALILRHARKPYDYALYDYSVTKVPININGMDEMGYTIEVIEPKSNLYFCVG